MSILGHGSISASRSGPAAVPSGAAVSARESVGRRAPLAAIEPTPARLAAVQSAGPQQASPVEANPGAYLGGPRDGSRHRVSFSVRDGSIRNLRVDGRAMAPRVEIVNGRVETHRLGFEMTATWLDERNLEGQVKMRGRWARGQSFRFSARQRVGDVLSGS